MKTTAIIIGALLAMSACQTPENSESMDTADIYTFNLADGVVRQKAHFKNRFGIELTGDLYMPASIQPGQKLPAIAVSGPYGAVKEQSSGLYANELASKGYITIAFDPSFTGESGGEPRYVSSPDINTEDFSAAVDYLSSLPEVDKDRIGIVGICGWGGIALNAAASDPRIKATVPVTMYDMHRVNANGYFDSEDSASARCAKRLALAQQRDADFSSGKYKLACGLPEERPTEPQFLVDYWDYYKTQRGYAPRSLNSNGGWNVTNSISWINTPILAYAGEIETPVMIVHGENAHSRYFGEDAFAMLKGENKRLLIVPGANHTDLYDGGPAHNMIPWTEIEAFLASSLAAK